jgi:hypothetical protein
MILAMILDMILIMILISILITGGDYDFNYTILITIIKYIEYIEYIKTNQFFIAIIMHKYNKIE